MKRTAKDSLLRAHRHAYASFVFLACLSLSLNVGAFDAGRVSVSPHIPTTQSLVSHGDSWAVPASNNHNGLPPPITYVWVQPVSTNVPIGGSALFQVIAQTDVGPGESGPDPTITIHYHWFKDETNRVGGDASNFSVETVRLSDVGSYHVVVSNAYGMSESVRVHLTLVLPPVVVRPPQSMATHSSSNATFFVEAGGTPPFSFQWRVDGHNIQSATNSSLTLSSMSRSKSGAYSVVITNSAGSVTSSPAALRVLVPQRLSMPQRIPNGLLKFSFGDSDGGPLVEADLGKFEVQSCTSLLSTNWVRVTNHVVFTNGGFMFHETVAAAQPPRFYRIIER